MKESQGKNTFSVEIRETRNQSWQGTLSCFDTEQELPFRSALELIRLIDSRVKSNDTVNQ